MYLCDGLQGLEPRTHSQKIGVSAAQPVGENQLIHCMAMSVLGWPTLVVLTGVGELPQGYITALNATLQIEIRGCTVSLRPQGGRLSRRCKQEG